ncbi:transcription factor cwo-like isoform X2 [Limulus polyphemus]|nr:transcription factor cwo-like isoform X2 [Limulus polyphemus]
MDARGSENEEFAFLRKRTIRDPMSHRIIEKRRRDRMNNCLADLSRLIPTVYLKKGRGRIEKTEIIEMAIKHIKLLQAQSSQSSESCEVAEKWRKWHYQLGFQECMSESLLFMVEREGLCGRKGLCVRLVNHLQQHYDKVARGICYKNDGIVTSVSSSEKSQGFAMNIKPQTSFPAVDPRESASSSFEQEAQLHLEQSNTPIGVALPQSDSKTSVSSSIATTSSDESQLREMLQKPGVPLEHIRCNTTCSDHSSFPNVLTSGNTVGHTIPKFAAKGEEVYNFKKNIKERFTADLQQHRLPPEGEEEISDLSAKSNLCSREDSVLSHPVSVIHAGQPERRISEISPSSSGSWNSNIEYCNSCESNPSPPSVIKCNGGGSSSGYSTSNEMSYSPKTKELSSFYQPESVLVHGSRTPIFALHPKGNFYIPLSLDLSLLAPIINSFDNNIPVLHPVSISVNFSFGQRVTISDRDEYGMWQQNYIDCLPEHCVE